MLEFQSINFMQKDILQIGVNKFLSLKKQKLLYLGHMKLLI